MNMLPPQFDIPMHPSCVPLSDETKELGRAKVAELRELLNRPKKRQKTNLEIVQEAADAMSIGSSALDFKNFLCKQKREQRNDQ